MNIPFIDLAKQYESYKNELDAAVLDIMSRAQFIMGPEVALLEEQLQHYTGAKYAITCANGTDALQLALMAIDVTASDEIITPSFTFIATAEAGAALGAKIVLCDIAVQDYNLDVNKLAELITPKTKVILPVSLYGQTANMQEVNKIAEEYGNKFGHKIYVIEDAAQSFGATDNGVKSCNLSEIATTSFFPSKPLGCYGDGGAVFTSNKMIAEKLSSLRMHGQKGRYNHEYIGINSRLDTIQAAILSIKLKHFDHEISRRQQLAAQYDNAFQHLECVIPQVLPDHTHVYGQYCIRVKQRDDFKKILNNKGVPTAVHYPKGIHEQPCFDYLGYSAGDFPVSHEVSKDIVGLPMSAFVTDEQRKYIIEQVQTVLTNTEVK